MAWTLAGHTEARPAKRKGMVVATALALSAFAIAGCTRTVGEGDPDIEAARTFDLYPLYWVGEHFEQWDLDHMTVAPDAYAEAGAVVGRSQRTVARWLEDPDLRAIATREGTLASDLGLGMRVDSWMVRTLVLVLILAPPLTRPDA